MHNIELQHMSPEFLKCWQLAGKHLNNQVQGGIGFWIRAHPNPPFLEHLSFRLGNQLFFVRVVDADEKVIGPGTMEGLLTIAKENHGHACLMPMQKSYFAESWSPVIAGWGLIDANTNKAIDPILLVTDEKIIMSPWEVHDLAVQAVRGYLDQKGYEIASWQSNPEVDPAIWFIGDSGSPEWISVRTAQYPDSNALRPTNWQAIVDSCKHMSQIGHFASVSFASKFQDFDSANLPVTPLWRGHGVFVGFKGLE